MLQRRKLKFREGQTTTNIEHRLTTTYAQKPVLQYQFWQKELYCGSTNMETGGTLKSVSPWAGSERI
jgi:hypothetical protein